MRNYSRFGNVRLAVVVGLAVVASGCSMANGAPDVERQSPPAEDVSSVGGSGGSLGFGGSEGGTDAGGSDGSGGIGGSAGEGAGGAGGGNDDTTSGQPGTAVVTGGGLCQSAGYTLWFSMGDSPGGNGKPASSPSYQHLSGVVATTQP